VTADEAVHRAASAELRGATQRRQTINATPHRHMAFRLASRINAACLRTATAPLFPFDSNSLLAGCL
jgi:hypothetical protein